MTHATNTEWKDRNLEHGFELVFDIADVQRLVDNIFYWGVERNITAAGGATAKSQIAKLLEEVKEIEEGIDLNDRVKVVDGIGDSFVVLIQICRLAGVSLVEALTQAWEDIKDRKGEMKCGVFVKEADLEFIANSADATHAYATATTPQQVKDAIDYAKEEALK